MNTQTQTKPQATKRTQIPASIVWFEIPADNVERARKFYASLFGWKIEKFPGAAVEDIGTSIPVVLMIRPMVG